MAPKATELQRAITERLEASTQLRDFRPTGDLCFCRCRGGFVDAFVIYAERRAGSPFTHAGCSAWCGSIELDQYVRNASISKSRPTYWNEPGRVFPWHVTVNLNRRNEGTPMFAPWVLSPDGEAPLTETVPERVFASSTALAEGLALELERSASWFDRFDSPAALYAALRDRAAGQGGYSDDLALQALAAHWSGHREDVSCAILHYQQLLEETEDLHRRSRRHGSIIEFIRSMLEALRRPLDDAQAGRAAAADSR